MAGTVVSAKCILELPLVHNFGKHLFRTSLTHFGDDVYGFADIEVREVNQIDLRPYLGADVPQDAYVRKLKDIGEALKTIATYARKVQ